MSHLNNLSIVIVTFLTDKKTLLNCLNSIDQNVNVLIVENSKKFKDREFFLSKFSNINIYCTGKNLGYGGGNNYGVRKTKTDFVLILNPDTILDKNFFRNLELVLKNKSFSLIGCQYSYDKVYTPGGFFNELKNRNFKEGYNSYKNKNLIEVDWIVGCSMLLNIKKIKSRNIFDENFFLYFEEYDFCKKLKNEKQKVYLSKNLKVHHLGFKSSNLDIENFKSESEKLRNWHYMWSSFFYYKKNYNHFYATYKLSDKLIKSFFKLIFFTIIFNKNNRNKYLYRFLGLTSSLLGKKSSYRGIYFH